ncbi:MAG: CHAT domain-containing protein [Leptolyngbyaceae cyanobacterium]
MTISNEMQAIIDRILHNTPADGDIETLRQWLQSSEGQQFAQQITQPAPPPAPSKYNINIDKITGGDVQIGDRTYNGTDAETLKNLVSSLLKKSQASSNSAAPAIAPRKILVLAASPEDQVRLNLEKEVREIDVALRLGSHSNHFILDQRWGVNRRDLQDIMLSIKPDILHFCGHGAKEQGLVFQNDNQNAQLVSNDALAELFSILTSIKPIPCIVLNACYSEAQVNAISPFIDYIVGMKKEIGDKAAIEFSRGFYRALSDGLPYNTAFRLGKNAIALDQIPENLTPVLKGKAIPQ